MNETQLKSLCDRIDQLERNVRHWKRVGIATVAVVILIIVGGATLQRPFFERVYTSQLEIKVNEDDSARGVLRTIEEGSDLLLRDSDQNDRVWITGERHGSVVRLWGLDKQPLIRISVPAAETGDRAIVEMGGKNEGTAGIRFRVGSEKSKPAVIECFDAEGNVQMAFGCTADGQRIRYGF